MWVRRCLRVAVMGVQNALSRKRRLHLAARTTRSGCKKGICNSLLQVPLVKRPGRGAKKSHSLVTGRAGSGNGCRALSSRILQTPLCEIPISLAMLPFRVLKLGVVSIVSGTISSFNSVRAVRSRLTCCLSGMNRSHMRLLV
ncbi:hypothetical protein TNCV_2865711 [Trichonephila clavipes]|nr:hypothetical protein TNCV_2865711 [Trichonephila clavipes]